MSRACPGIRHPYPPYPMTPWIQIDPPPFLKKHAAAGIPAPESGGPQRDPPPPTPRAAGPSEGFSGMARHLRSREGLPISPTMVVSVLPPSVLPPPPESGHCTSPPPHTAEISWVPRAAGFRSHDDFVRERWSLYFPHPPESCHCTPPPYRGEIRVAACRFPRGKYRHNHGIPPPPHPLRGQQPHTSGSRLVEGVVPRVVERLEEHVPADEAVIGRLARRADVRPGDPWAGLADTPQWWGRGDAPEGPRGRA